MGNATSVRIHWADNDEFQFLSFVIYDFKYPYPIFVVDKLKFMRENDEIYGKKLVEDPGDSTVFKSGQIVSARKLRDQNSQLKLPYEVPPM